MTNRSQFIPLAVLMGVIVIVVVGLLIQHPTNEKIHPKPLTDPARVGFDPGGIRDRGARGPADERTALDSMAPSSRPSSELGKDRAIQAMRALQELRDIHLRIDLDAKLSYDGLDNTTHRRGMRLGGDQACKEFNESIEHYNTFLWERGDGFVAFLGMLRDCGEPKLVRLAAQYASDGEVSGFAFQPKQFYAGTVTDDLISVARGEPNPWIRDLAARAIDALGSIPERTVKELIADSTVDALMALHDEEGDSYRKKLYLNGLCGLSRVFPSVHSKVVELAFDLGGPPEVRQRAGSRLRTSSPTQPHVLQAALAFLEDPDYSMQFRGTYFFEEPARSKDEEEIHATYFEALKNKLIDPITKQNLRDDIAERLATIDRRPEYLSLVLDVIREGGKLGLDRSVTILSRIQLVDGRTFEDRSAIQEALVRISVDDKVPPEIRGEAIKALARIDGR